MVARPAQASILVASIADINIAFCRTHDGISHALRDALVSVPEKATNALKLGWIFPETARKLCFQRTKIRLGLGCTHCCSDLAGLGGIF